MIGGACRKRGLGVNWKEKVYQLKDLYGKIMRGSISLPSPVATFDTSGVRTEKTNSAIFSGFSPRKINRTD